MAVKSIGVGRVVEEAYPFDEDPSPKKFRFNVLKARDRAHLRDLQDGHVEATGAIRIDSGTFTYEAARLGLAGWELGAVVFGPEHPDVLAGKVGPDDPVKWRGVGKHADPRDLDVLPEPVLAWAASRTLEINTITSAEGKGLSSGDELPFTEPSSTAPDAPSATATSPGNSGPQDDS